MREEIEMLKRSWNCCFVAVVVTVLAASMSAQETIYVGQNDPSAMHAFTFDGVAFAEQTLDPANPAQYVHGGLNPFVSAVSDHFFIFGNSAGEPISVVDPSSALELPRIAGTGGATAAIIVTPDQRYALAIGQDLSGSPAVSVVDISPSDGAFLSEVSEVSLLSGSNDPVLQSAGGSTAGGAVLSGATLYVPLSGGNLDSDGAVVAIDVSSLPIAGVLSAVRLSGNPASNLRYGTIGGSPYLFATGRNLSIVPVSGPTFGAPINFSAGQNLNTGRHRNLQDVYVEDGSSPKAIASAISFKDSSFTAAEDEILTIDLSGVLTDSSGDCQSGGPRPCTSSVATLDPAADGGGLRVERSLGGSYLYVLEAALDPFFCPSRLHAYSIAGLNAGLSSAPLATQFVDSLSACPPNEPPDSPDYLTWLQRPEIVAWGVGLTVRNAVTAAGSGVKITDANAELGKTFTNDIDQTLTITGSQLDRVVNAYLGKKVLAIQQPQSSTTITATIPAFVPTGDQSLILTDSTGGVTAFPATFTVNDPPQYLPKAVVYAVGGSCEQYSRINTASGSEVVSNFTTNTQGTFCGKVTKDGRYLVTSGFRDGRIAIHSLIANPDLDQSKYGWNTVVNTLYAAGDAGIVGNIVQNPAAGRSTVYISNDFDAIYMLDPTTTPPTLIDADGDPSTTDPGMESNPGVSGIPIPVGGYRSLAIRADVDSQYLYAATGVAIVRIDVTSTLVTGANVTSYPTGLPDGRARSLAISADGTKLFFGSIREATIRVYSRSTVDGSIDTSTYTTLTPPGGWLLGDSLFILASPDGRALYVAAPVEGRLDIFDVHDLSNIAWIAKRALPAGVSGIDITPASDYLFVSTLGDDSVLSIYEGAPALGLTPNGVISAAGSACGTAGVTVSPGAGTEIGPDVRVTPTQGSAITFSEVTTGGNTTVTSTNANAVTLPPNLEIAGTGAPVYYDVSTTAGFSGPVTVCLAYDPAGLSLSAQQSLVLRHLVGANWVDVTTGVDTVHDQVCGQVTSFSQFVIAQSTVPVNVASQSSFSSKGNGNLNLTIFGSSTFDATQIDASTLVLLPQGAISAFRPGAKVSGTQDINKDHIADLTVSFPRQYLKVSGTPGGSGTVYLQGRLFDGTAFSGQAPVTFK
jgi:hypothetical protein